MDKYLTDKKYWEKRSKTYDKQQWVKREGYIEAFVRMCRPKKKDTVLDLGTGTGTIAYVISSKVKNVVGVDISMAMLGEAQKYNHTNNVQFMRSDIRSLSFLDESFSLVTARMVFHHLLIGLNRAVKETFRVLKPGGLFCLSEGVPPDRCVEDFYKAVFKLKEKRRTFFPEDLKNLLIKGGFGQIQMKEYIMKHCSIRNWLDNAGNLSDEAKRKIYQMHINLHDEGRKAYNMKITQNDCFIDMKFIIVNGIK